MSAKKLHLVLIYLGNKVPRYVIQNCNRLAELFDYKVYLFVDSLRNIPGDVDIDARVNLRKLDIIETPDETLFGHDKEFRSGFWLHTFNRLLQIKAIHRELGAENSILHIEADMLLMPSFPFNIVLADRLKWFRYNNFSDVASLVYYPNLQETDWIHSQLLGELTEDPNLTDMSALRKIREKNPSRIEVFQDIFMSEDRDQDQGLFDGLSLGSWLCGIDTRNTFGLLLIHENGEDKAEGTKDLGDLVSESTFNLKDGRIQVSRNGVMQTLHCLHIHSKDEEILCLDNLDKVNKLLKLAKDNYPIVTKFRFKVFIELLNQNWEKGTLIAYLRNLLQFLSKKDKRGKSRLFVILEFIFRRRGVR